MVQLHSKGNMGGAILHCDCFGWCRDFESCISMMFSCLRSLRMCSKICKKVNVVALPQPNSQFGTHRDVERMVHKSFEGTWGCRYQPRNSQDLASTRSAKNQNFNMRFLLAITTFLMAQLSVALPITEVRGLDIATRDLDGRQAQVVAIGQSILCMMHTVLTPA